MKTRRQSLSVVASLAIACAMGTVSTASAEDAASFPSKPITIIVNFGAGGPTDLPPRQIATYLEKKFKQAVVVENRTGGAGVVGLAAIAKAAPDGYTIGTFSSSPAIIAPKLRQVPYDPKTDFTPIAQIAVYTMPLCVLPGSPFKSFKDMVEEARRNPGKVTYSTVGTGSGQNIFMEALGKAEGVKFTHVPFTGGSSGIAALMGGHVAASLDAALGKNASTGDCRALASVGSKRLPALGDVPTFQELGYQVDVPLWLALAGPAGIPAEIAKKLSDAIIEATAQPEYKDLLTKLMLLDQTAGAAEVQARFKADETRMGAMMEELGFLKK